MNVLWIILVIVGVVLVICTAGFFFLAAPKKVNKKDYAWLTETDFAHRGLYTADQTVPENSMQAFSRAVQEGYGIELDVELTSDDILVVFHDDALERMTGKAKKLWDSTYDELQQLSLARSDQKIPLFSDVLKLVDGRANLIVEIKNTSKLEKICTMTYALLKEYNGHYCIESFNPLIVAWFRKNAPEVLRGQLSTRYKNEKNISKLKQFLLENLLLNFLAKPQFIAYHYKDCDKLVFKLCRKFGALMVAWTVDSKQSYQLSKKEYDAIIFEHILPHKSADTSDIMEQNKVLTN